MATINDVRLSYTSLIGHRTLVPSPSVSDMIDVLDQKIDEIAESISVEQESMARVIARAGVAEKIISTSSSFHIHEKDVNFDSIEEHDEWQCRVTTIEKAMAVRSIFSVSIVPNDPSIYQTWYAKRVTYRPPVLDVAACAAANIDLSALEEDNGPSEMISFAQSEQALATIHPNLKAPIATVLESFQEDIHARGLGFILIEAGCSKSFYFTKG